MAEYKITYTMDGVEKNELIYKGRVFSFRMVPHGFGKTADKKGFDYQVAEHFQNEDEEVLAALSEIHYADTDEIMSILQLLDKQELPEFKTQIMGEWV